MDEEGMGRHVKATPRFLHNLEDKDMTSYKDAHELYPIIMCDICHKKKAALVEQGIKKCETCWNTKEVRCSSATRPSLRAALAQLTPTMKTETDGG